MPTTYETLRKKFFVYDDKGNVTDDGIAKAEAILIASGYTVDKGYIDVVNFNHDQYTNGEIQDAIQFLIEEWDYSMKAR